MIGLAFTENPSALANVRGDGAELDRPRAMPRASPSSTSLSHALVAVHKGRIVGTLNAAKWPHCQMSTVEKIKTAPSMIRIMGSALPGPSR